MSPYFVYLFVSEVKLIIPEYYVSEYEKNVTRIVKTKGIMFLDMGRLFSTYVEFSEKLIYITPRYANIREHMHIKFSQTVYP